MAYLFLNYGQGQLVDMDQEGRACRVFAGEQVVQGLLDS